MTDNVAILRGYTREVEADSAAYTLHLLVMPGQDYDETFKAWDMDEQEFIEVDGWLWSFETIEDHGASLSIRHAR